MVKTDCLEPITRAWISVTRRRGGPAGWSCCPVAVQGLDEIRPRHPWGHNGSPQMDIPPDNPRRPRRRVDRRQLALRDLLAAVAGTRQTRVELLSSKLDIDEARVRPAWDLALRTELLEPVSIEPGTGETMYRLSHRGRRALRVLSLGRRSPHQDE